MSTLEWWWKLQTWLTARNALALGACSSPVGAAGEFEVTTRPILEVLFCLGFIVSLVKFHIQSSQTPWSLRDHVSTVTIQLNKCASTSACSSCSQLLEDDILLLLLHIHLDLLPCPKLKDFEVILPTSQKSCGQAFRSFEWTIGTRNWP
jgi:hypothetical protein